MGKKKLLHLITGLEVGGTEMMLLRTLPGLQEKFDNRVCSIMGHGFIGDNLEGAGIPVYYLGLKNIFDIRTIFRFRKIVREFKPDVLINYLIHADLFGRIFGKIFGVKKIVSSQRGSLLNWEWLRFFDKITSFLIYRYIVQTETARNNLLHRLNLNKEKVLILPNAIDIIDFDFYLDEGKKKDELSLNSDFLNIICVSNLRIGKGHIYLLRSFEDIYQKHKNINLLIVGDGNQKASLLKQVSDYASRKNIYFLGERNDIKELLRISDIFVLPTLAEGMSNSILEAMTSKLPVVTTDIPENQALIENNVDGILIPPKNSLELSKKIEELINNPQKRKAMGANAFRKIKDNFGIKKITLDLESIYFSITK
jgi:glycosyltransferase involved in cell wall biosynthesis